MGRVLAYARVSTDLQSDKGQSMPHQEAEIRAFCENNGHTLVNLYKEEGVSGSKHISTRPEGARFLQRLYKGDIDLMVVTRLDRCWRSAIDCMSMVEKMNKKKVGLVILNGFNGTDIVDTTSPMGEFTLGIMAMFAQLERSMIADRTRSAIQAKKKDMQLYSTVPLGFDLEEDTKRLIPNDEELAVVRRIHGMKKEGESIRGIARILNEEGVPTKQKKQWHPTSIVNTLKNDIYESYL